MRAHEGTLGPATLTDRSANGLLAELGAPDRYERTCLGDRAYDAMVNNFRASRREGCTFSPKLTRLARRKVHILGMAGDS